MDAPPGTRLRVMLVDDHEIVRSGITAMLAATDDMRVVAEAESVEQAVREAERTRPDVVVMDIRLVDGSGIEATREIRARLPNTKVLMLRGGKIIFEGTDESLHKCEDQYIQRFIRGH